VVVVVVQALLVLAMALEVLQKIVILVLKIMVDKIT
jgi:hypothetical protein